LIGDEVYAKICITTQRCKPVAEGNEDRSCCDNLTNRLSRDVFKALSDSNRIAILAHLVQRGGEQKVTDVSCCCPVDISVVSRHLGVLRDAGILESRKSGREVFYSVRVANLAAFLRDLADALEACCPDGSCPSGKEP
jgi:ArsR family transcriptional regulator